MYSTSQLQRTYGLSRRQAVLFHRFCEVENGDVAKAFAALRQHERERARRSVPKTS